MTLLLYNTSLNKIKGDIDINRVTTWFNYHKVCSLIHQIEGDEFYVSISFWKGCRGCPAITAAEPTSMSMWSKPAMR